MEDKRLDQYCISHIHKLKRNCNKVLFPFFPIDLINNAYNIGHPSVVTSPKLEIDSKCLCLIVPIIEKMHRT